MEFSCAPHFKRSLDAEFWFTGLSFPHQHKHSKPNCHKLRSRYFDSHVATLYCLILCATSKMLQMVIRSPGLMGYVLHHPRAQHHLILGWAHSEDAVLSRQQMPCAASQSSQDAAEHSKHSKRHHEMLNLVKALCCFSLRPQYCKTQQNISHMEDAVYHKASTWPCCTLTPCMIAGHASMHTGPTLSPKL